MRHSVRAIVGVVLFAAAGSAAGAAIDGWPAVDGLEASARRAGLRVVESARLVLATDRPARDGDGVDDLPAIFDRAFAHWCDHYGIDPATLPRWRAFGCLVVDRERFRAAGLLPDAIPDFANGFCADHVFWLQDQANAAYRRHLLLHEGVHAFTLTVRGLATPVWYGEGIAEFLATHRLDADAPTGFVATPMPAAARDVEQLGRIEEIRDRRADGRIASLTDVLATPGGQHRSLADYAASWAAVVLFARHPAYAEAFTGVERGRLGPDFNDRLAAMPGFDPGRAARDFDALTDEIDYGYDFARSAVDWSPGRPLVDRADVAVTAGRGWQNTGVAVSTGACVDLRATGRCTLGRIAGTTITTEPEGVSLTWYRGRPLGRLLAAQWIDTAADGGRPRFEVIGTGAMSTVTAVADGPLYLKLNEPPGDLTDDAGEFAVEIVRVAPP